MLLGDSEVTQRGHATIYIIERESIKTYGFVVVNTGEGNDYHPFFRGDYPKEKRRSAIRLGDITRERILEQGFWFLLFKMRYQSSSVHGPLQLYEVLLPFLANPTKSFYRKNYDSKEEDEGEIDYVQDIGTSKLDLDQPTRSFDCTFAMNLDRQLRKENCGDFETMQRSGTCFYRALLGAIRYCCKRAGFTVPQRKQLMYAYRIAFLFHTKADLIRLNNYLEKKVNSLPEPRQPTNNANRMVRHQKPIL